MTAPERIWIDAWGGNWSPQAGGTQGVEYIRADIAAVQSAQVRVKPLVWEEDGHGNFRAQSVRGGEGVDRIIELHITCDDRVTYEAWGIKDSFDDPVAAMSAVEAEISSEILAALEPQPATPATR